MARLKRDLDLHLRADQLGALTETGSRLAVDDLVVRIHGEKVSAWVPGRSQYTTPPRLRARIDRSDGGGSLVGSIRESRGTAMISGWGKAMIMVFMYLVAALGVVTLFSSVGGLYPLIIGGVFAAIFTMQWVKGKPLRRSSFRIDADDLDCKLGDYLGVA